MYADDPTVSGGAVVVVVVVVVVVDVVVVVLEVVVVDDVVVVGAGREVVEVVAVRGGGSGRWRWAATTGMAGCLEPPPTFAQTMLSATTNATATQIGPSGVTPTRAPPSLHRPTYRYPVSRRWMHPRANDDPASGATRRRQPRPLG